MELEERFPRLLYFCRLRSMRYCVVDLRTGRPSAMLLASDITDGACVLVRLYASDVSESKLLSSVLVTASSKLIIESVCDVILSSFCLRPLRERTCTPTSCDDTVEASDISLTDVMLLYVTVSVTSRRPCFWRMRAPVSSGCFPDFDFS